MCIRDSEYIINDAHIHTLFVGEQLQYNNAFKVQKESQYLKRLVVFDPAVKLNPEDKTSIYFDDFLRLGDNAHAETTVKIRTNEAVPEDLATIIYTSGTTGESKGVMLHHSNYLEAMRIHDIRLPMVTDKDLSMCFLPLTHIFEKAWSYYCLHKGVTIAINQDPKMIQKTLPEVHPTLMCNVPRFWEKVYACLLYTSRSHARTYDGICQTGGSCTRSCYTLQKGRFGSYGTGSSSCAYSFNSDPEGV